VELLQDLRYGARTLVRNPAFAALAIGCLAIGIGVNSTIFSIVDALLLRPFAFKDPDALVALHTTRKIADVTQGAVSYLDWQDWRERTHSFSQTAAFSGRSFVLSDGTESERFFGTAISATLFPMLGVEPVKGRILLDEEDRPGGADVVILSYAVWQRRYASDPGIVGRSITVDGRPRTVVGVMAEHFQFPPGSQIWVPLAPSEYQAPRSQRNLGIYGRLKPGLSIQQAQGDLAAVAAGLAGEHPEDRDWGSNVVTIRDDLSGPNLKLMLYTMMGAVSLVLLIACANVTNLLLTRATIRQREVALRAALGAGRGRIMRQFLTESVLIALTSAPLGVALAWVGLKWFNSAFPPDAQAGDFFLWEINWRVIAYTCAISAFTGLIFGIVPALQAARTNLQDSLKDGARGSGGGSPHGRLRGTLVVVEIALALVLLVGASLFTRSFLNLQSARAGLEPAPWLLMNVSMSGPQYTDPAAMARRADDLVQRIEGLPGVTAVTASNMLPFAGGAANETVEAEGSSGDALVPPTVFYFTATPHVFRALGVTMVAGRDFSETDGSRESDAAIVNQVFAKQFWPTESSVLGRRFRLTRDKDGRWFTVVGVVPDFRLFTVRSGKPPAYVFVSYPHRPALITGLTIRAAVPPATLTAAVRQEIRNADPTLGVFRLMTGDQARTLSLWADHLFAWMFSIFGVIALILASIGVYGVLSYSVAQRTQEIGVRIALGATNRNVFSLILGQGARLAAIGLLVGVAGAFGVTRVIRSLLYNVGPTDVLSFVLPAAFLVLVALIASYVPAQRATLVEPLVALRSE